MLLLLLFYDYYLNIVKLFDGHIYLKFSKSVQSTTGLKAFWSCCQWALLTVQIITLLVLVLFIWMRIFKVQVNGPLPNRGGANQSTQRKNPTTSPKICITIHILQVNIHRDGLCAIDEVDHTLLTHKLDHYSIWGQTDMDVNRKPIESL